MDLLLIRELSWVPLFLFGTASKGFLKGCHYLLSDTRVFVVGIHLLLSFLELEFERFSLCKHLLRLFEEVHTHISSFLPSQSPCCHKEKNRICLLLLSKIVEEVYATDQLQDNPQHNQGKWKVL